MISSRIFLVSVRHIGFWKELPKYPVMNVESKRDYDMVSVPISSSSIYEENNCYNAELQTHISRLFPLI